MDRLKKIRYRVARPSEAIIEGVRLDISSAQISSDMKRRIYIGNYEKEERQIVERLLREDDRVLELGSGLGYISVICARKIGGDRVVTVEANPEMEQLIRRSFELNGVSPKLVMGAAGPEAGVVEFFFEENFWSNSSLPSGKSTKSQKVRVLPITELMEQHRPTVLICDIEGGEHALFPRLPLEGVRLIVLELHPKRLGIDTCSELVALIMGRGFSIDVANTVLGTVTFQRRN